MTDELSQMRNPDAGRRLPGMRVPRKQDAKEAPIGRHKKSDAMIETPSLLLRPFDQSDLDLIYRIYSDDEILRYTPFDPMDREQAERHLNQVMADWQCNPRLSYELAVCLKKSGETIGRAHILIDPETETGMIGMLLIQDFWGNQYATEIAEALIAYSFNDLHLHRVNAVCNPENTASWKLLEKCGLRREALLKEKCRYIKRGTITWHDELEYAILASEYLEQKMQ